MNKSLMTIPALIAFGVCGSAASAAISVNITADNHYALFARTAGVTSFIGGNELGSSGSPGTYNWSLPESYQFDTPDTLYIAVWSDDSVAQGLLAEFSMGDNVFLRTGDPQWEVYPAGINLDDMAPYPTAGEIDGHVAFADANLLWQAPHIGEANVASTGPWGAIPGISANTHWTWGNPSAVGDPLRGGANHDELQIFRIVVPSPGAVTLAGFAGLLVVRRRRLN